MPLLCSVLILATSLYVCVALLFLIGLFHPRCGKSAAQPFVSVIVAARNEEAFIGDCLAGLVWQTYPPDRHEILVVDDDSEDRTREIAKAFCERHPHVR